MFKVEYKYSACIKVITNDVKILCDPWFGENAYDGTWQQYPSIKETLKLVGHFDFIYISHIHPDHYCSETIALLMNHYIDKKIIIADWGSQANYLAKKIAADGHSKNLIVSNNLEIGDTLLKIIPNLTGSNSDIDSAIIIASKSSKKSVLNVNDCIYNDNFYEKINTIKKNLDLEFTLFCLGYTGAGPYPQTYYSPIYESEKLLELAEIKKQEFFKRYLKAISKIKSKKRLPFAGKYFLKGDLSILNKFRGVADALEIKKFDKDAVILDDGGDAYFDLESLTAFKTRKKLYNQIEYLPSDNDYKWRKIIGFIPDPVLLKRLLIKSIANAHKKSECNDNCYWSIYTYDSPSKIVDIWSSKEPWKNFEPLFTFNCNKNTDPQKILNKPKCHSHMFIESKALFAVLTGITHWNNYSVGSVFQVRRIPDIYIETMQKYINFLSVI